MIMDGKTKGTIQMMDPNIFVTHVLVVNKNLKPERILKMWADNSGYYSDRERIKPLIERCLELFWHSVGLNRFSNEREAATFLNRYRNVSAFKRFWYKIKSL